MAGDWAGGALYDLFFGGKKSSNRGIAKAAGGGQPSTRGGKPTSGPSRRVKKTKTKRAILVQPTPIKPGTNVGGEKNIEKVFPKSTDKTKVSPLDYVESSYNKISDEPFFGPLMSISTKALVGQKPGKVDYKNAAQGLSNWMNSTFSDEILRTGALYAAGGGEIDADMLSKKSGDMTDAIAKSLEDNISRRVDDAINDLMKQMMLKDIEPKIKEKEGTGEPLTPEGIPLGEGETASGRTLMSGLVQRGFTKEEASAIVGNLWAESGFRTTATNPTSGAFGLMQWLGGRKSRLYAYAAEQGKQVTDVNLQLDYIKWELKGGNAYETAQFQKAMAYGSSVADKTRGFAYEVERASVGELRSSMSKRVGAAESVYGGRMVAGETPSSNIQLGKGYGREGSKIAGELGRFLKQKGVVPGSIHRHPEHPPYSLSSGHSRDSYHYQGRAIDLGGYTREQGPILSAIAEFNRIKGVKPVQLLHGGNEPRNHWNHVHVAYFHGGLVKKTGLHMLHQGEFVVDKDSVDLLGKDFIATINEVENKSQLKQKANSLISVLQNYTDYEMPSPEVVYIPVPISNDTPEDYSSQSSGGLAMFAGGEADDPFKTLYQGT
jgi:hypothetical protein